MTSPSVISEYFSYVRDFRKEYGDDVVVLMQIGSFYEILGTDTDVMSGVAEVLNVVLTKKNKTIPEVSPKNPLMCGFPVVSLNKYLGVLIDNGYTVAQIDQTNSASKVTQRTVTRVYSKSCPPMDLDGKHHMLGNCVVGVYLEQGTTGKNVAGALCAIDTAHGNVHVFETTGEHSQVLEDMYPFLHSFTCNEVIVLTPDEQLDPAKSTVDALDIACSVHIRRIREDFLSVKFQNEFLARVYPQVEECCFMAPLEILNLERLPCSAACLLAVLDFLHNHNPSLLKNIERPVVLSKDDCLRLESNTLHQLHVLAHPSTKRSKYDSLFSMLDNTKTAIGKRELKQRLTQPFVEACDMQERYALSEEYLAVAPNVKQGVSDILSRIRDFERLHRKLLTDTLKPSDLYVLHVCYSNVMDLVTALQGTPLQDLLTQQNKQALKECIATLETSFDVSALSGALVADVDAPGAVMSFVRKGVHETIDSLCVALEGANREIAGIARDLALLARLDGTAIKTATSAEGVHLFTTSIRGKAVEIALAKRGGEGDSGYVFKTSKAGTRITSPRIDQLSGTVVLKTEALHTQQHLFFQEIVTNIGKTYRTLFDALKTFVALVDITQCNVKNAEQYKYCRPEVSPNSEDDRSFVHVHALRHPVIERISDVPYVPNDVFFGNGNETGMILYGLNAGGKSSLLRSVGLAVVMAQAGLYVPATSMQFSPYDNVVSQVDLHDNLWKGQSSFVSEMIGLRNILKRSGRRTLVLADEVCKGSEVTSATAIFTAVAKVLSEKGATFMFTTHLHDVAELVQDVDGIRVCHLSVDVDRGGDITFERTLKDGPCDKLYGLEVARAIDIDRTFVDEAFTIRNRLNGDLDRFSGKTSKYNAKKILRACQVCGHAPKTKREIPLDVHHIKFQCHADAQGYIGHTYKHAKSNLVTLCKECHQDAHSGLLTIDGYVQTTKGVKLQYKRCAAIEASSETSTVPLL